ncbi:hypothetical protein IJT93_03855 [bacterium]|nr:hypothetical protein [bacterium]
MNSKKSKNNCISLKKPESADKAGKSGELPFSEAETIDMGNGTPSWHEPDKDKTAAAETASLAGSDAAAEETAAAQTPAGDSGLHEKFDGEIKPAEGRGAKTEFFSLKAAFGIILVLILLGAGVFFFYSLAKDNDAEYKPILETAVKLAPENTDFLAVFDFEKNAEMFAVQRKMAESFLNNAALMSAFINKDAAIGKYVDFNRGLSKHLTGGGALFGKISVGSQPGFGKLIFLLKIDDEKAVADILEHITASLESKRLLSYTVQTCGDLQIHVPTANQSGAAWAVKDGLLWLGGSAEALREILQPEPGFRSLASSPVYQKALLEASHHENGLIYCNMAEVFGSLGGGDDNLLIYSLKNGRYGIVGFKVRGGEAASKEAVLEYNGRIVFTEAFVSKVKAKIFNSGNVIEFKSLKYQPVDNGSCLGVNIRMLFDLFGETLGQVSEMGASEGGSSWVVRSAAYMLRPLLECCSGELTFSLKNLGELSGSRGLNGGGGSADIISKLRSEKWTVCLGLRSREEFEAALDGVPFLSAFLKRAEQRGAGSAKIYNLFGGVQMAMTDGMLIFLGNSSAAEADRAVSGGLENSWHKELVKLNGGVPFKGIGFMVEDVRANTKAIADGLSGRGGADAGAAKTLWSVSETLGIRCSVLSVDDRGLVISGAAEFSAE